MLDRSYLGPSEALSRLFEALPSHIPSSEVLPVEHCYGRVVAADIVATEDLPGFARSTVDGYAVCAANTFGARESMPAYLTVSGEVLMGAQPRFSVEQGGAVKIPTGGMLPEGADAVVMIEDTQAVSADAIEVLRPAAPGENIIRKDEDIRSGATVLQRGRRLRPQDIGALAGLGITRVEVFRKPVVSLISTGDEIMPASSPAAPGRVRDINSYTLDGLISGEGAVVIKAGIISDEYELIADALRRALAVADMVLIIGGTSAGTKDMTARVIEEAGHPGVLFHGVKLKPGKPLIGGVVDGKPVLGLPGHPAAAAVSFDQFIKPLLQRIGGCRASSFRATVRAVMACRIASAAGRQDHIRVALSERGGIVYAQPVLGKSGLITTLVKADGMITIQADALGLDQGAEVDVRLF